MRIETNSASEENYHGNQSFMNTLMQTSQSISIIMDIAVNKMHATKPFPLSF